MKIGFTGTQEGLTRKQEARFDVLLMGLTGEFHHGDCIGADSEAHDIAREQGFHIVIHPPVSWTKRARKSGDELRKPLPYLDRNRKIVDETEMLIAAPKGMEEKRSGTWATVRYARKLKRPIIIVYPDGRVERE